MADLNWDVEKLQESQKVEIEYEGRIISVDAEDLILLSDGRGGEKLGVADPEKYDDDPFESVAPSGISSEQEITGREYEEEERARRWANVVEDLELREIDEKALALAQGFGEAKNAAPPAIGASGSVVITHS
ncbi:MAG: hypothetical protein LBB28_02105, partial [Synergistaceae bacterium]|nr:hypothetical protein [Synergistaceae bacterium]